MSRFFIITDYNHLPNNIEESWISRFVEQDDDYLIYDRADRWQESSHIKKQVNVGENIYDFAYFIVENWNNLPDIMIFVKADVVPRHCGEEKFSKLIESEKYTPIENYVRSVSKYYPGAYAYVDDYDGYWENKREIDYLLSNIHQGRRFLSYKSFLDEVFEDASVSDYIRFAPGGNHLIPRSSVIRYNKYFYEMLKDITSWEVRPGEAFLLERAIYTLYTNDFKIREKYRG